MIPTNPTPIILLIFCHKCFLVKHGLLLSLFPLGMTNVLLCRKFLSLRPIQLPSIFNKANPIIGTLYPALPEV